jgi:hypothetical protein
MWSLSIVINGLKLALLLSAATIYLAGLGWLGFRLINKENRMGNWSLLQAFPLVLACGLIINLCIVLLLQQILPAFLAGCMLSASGIYFLVRDITSLHLLSRLTSEPIYPWIGAVIVCLLFLGPILAYPLKDWDARSIWFFHAKMIYTEGTMGQSAG